MSDRNTRAVLENDDDRDDTIGNRAEEVTNKNGDLMPIPAPPMPWDGGHEGDSER